MQPTATIVEYTGPERRMRNQTLTDVEEVLDRMLKDHEIREKLNMAAEIDALKVAAFPDGAEKHKSSHQAMIDAAKAQETFWRGLREEVARKSIWGILQILVILAVAGLGAKLGLGALVAGVMK